MIKVENLFGEGAAQSEQYLIIDKTDLRITADENNRAESLFAAIILKSSKQYEGVLTDENNNPITDPEGNKITYDNKGLFTQTQLTYYDRYLPTGIIRDVFEFLELVPDD